MPKALIVVDMVRGFVEPETSEGKCALYLPDAKNIIPEINRIMNSLDKDDKIIFVCDWHEHDDKEFKKYPPHCIQGTEESLIAKGIDVKGKKVSVVLKNRFSGFYQTGLQLDLISKSVQELIIVGVCTDICVLCTTADALMGDFKVTVPANAVSGLTKEGHEMALKIMKTLGANVVESM